MSIVRFSSRNVCRKFTVPLQWVLVVPFVLQMGAVVALVGYLSYRSGQQAIEDLAYQLINQVEQQVLAELDQYLEDTHQFNQRQVVAIASGVIDAQNLDQLHRHLILQHQQTEYLATVLFGTPQGDLRASHRVTPRDYGATTQLQPDELPFEAAVSISANPATSQTYSIDAAGHLGRYLETIENIDVRDRFWYRQAVETGKAGWTGPFQIGNTDLLALSAYAPVYDGASQLLGVVAVRIRLNQLGRFLDALKVGQSGEVFIIDRQGFLIANSTPEPSYLISGEVGVDGWTQPGTATFQRRSPESLSNTAIQQAYRYLETTFPQLQEVQSPQTFHITPEGQHYFLAVAPYQDDFGLDWLVVTVIPEADFTAEIQRNIRNTGFLCLLALGGAMILGWAIARRFTRRIAQLDRASQALAAGDLTQQLPVNSAIAEVKGLAQSFNRMAEQLRHLFQGRVELEASRQSEARFQQLASVAPGMIYTFIQWPDGTYGFEYASSACRDILELEPEQVLADVNTVLDQIHPDDRPLYETAGDHSMKTLEPFNFTFRNITPSGQLKWLELRSRPLRHDNGSVTWHGVVLDISDRKHLELALQRSEAKLNDVLNSAHYASIVSFRVFRDRRWEYEYQSPGCKNLFGYTADEICNNKDLWMSQVYAPDRETILYPLFDELFQGNSATIEFRFHHKDGSLRWIEATYTSRYDRVNDYWVVTGVSTDITQRKQIESALGQSEERLQVALEAARMGNWEWNIETNQIFWSESLERLMGLQPGTFDGNFETVAAMVYPDDRGRVLEAITQSVHQGANYDIEFRFVKPDGSVRWALSKGNVFRDASGRAIRMAGLDIDITDRKLAEISLQQTLQELTHHIQTSPLATIRWDRNFRVELWSPQAEQMFGWTAAEVLGKTFQDWRFVVEEDWEHVRHYANQLLTGASTICHNRNYRKDGAIVYCEWYNSILLDEQGNLVSILSLVQDVSDRKRDEMALEEEIRHRKTLFDTSIDGIVVLDQWGQVVEANASFAAMTGYSLEELLTLNVRDLDAQWSPEELTQKNDEKALCDNTFETRHRRKDGSIYDVEVSSSSANWYGQAVQLCICRDISDRKQTETILRRSEATLAQAQRVAQIGSWSFDPHTQKITWSDELFRMFGLDPSQPEPAYDDHLQNNFHPEDRAKLEQCVRRAIADGNSYILDYRAILPDGSIRYHEGRGEVEYNAEGQIVRLYGTAQDITERKQVEQELEQARDAAETANRAKSAFLSTMSHELRTPLNVILGFTQLMNQDITLTPDHQEYIQLIHKNGSHLLQLINDVLDLSRIEAGRLSLDPKMMDLLSLLESVGSSFRQQAHRRHLQFHLHIAADVPQYIVADSQKIHQILLNLLGNAVKFTPSGYITLRVSVRPASEWADAVSLLPPTDQISLCFTVEDTGIGIAPLDLDMIFDAFTQVTTGHDAQEGSGLGLSISRRLAQLMGGDITVWSTVGQGSTFQVQILVQPVSPPPDATNWLPRRVVGVEPTPFPYRILVVDDQAENCLLLRKLLEPLGFLVVTVANGQEAIHQWEQWQPHLIWMDLRMPAPDGYQTTQHIRQAEQQVRNQKPAATEGLFSPERPLPCVIIALTAQSTLEDRDRALATGCDDYISKPFNRDDILDILARYLGVRYRYGDAVASHKSAEPQPSLLTAEHLAVMPRDWVLTLHQVALSCEQRAVQHVIRQIPPEHGVLSSQLEHLAHDFDFATILHLAQAYLDQ